VASKKLAVDEIAEDIADASQLATDAEIARLRSELASCRGRYKAALAQIDAERERADAIAGLSGIKSKPAALTRSVKGKKHQASVIVLLSDWHVEERVDPATVNHLNEFDLDVCDKRIAELSERFATLLEHERHLVNVDRVVIWAGGDFISGAIHPDTADLAQLPPLAALRFAGERLRGFIDRAAGMAKEVIVVTNSGNHGRTTEKLRVGTELDNSYEQHLYLQMATQEKNENVRWQVGEGYLNILDLDGFVVRFHHGHAVRYSGGGVGGITIPINKSISAWDKIRPADLTCQGHYHQFQWVRANKYVANGSLIGHSAYATMIKAAYEPPCQSFIVVDHGRREVTKALPIFCDRDLQRRKR
jgi:hypothetical protein